MFLTQLCISDCTRLARTLTWCRAGPRWSQTVVRSVTLCPPWPRQQSGYVSSEHCILRNDIFSCESNSRTSRPQLVCLSHFSISTLWHHYVPNLNSNLKTVFRNYRTSWPCFHCQYPAVSRRSPTVASPPCRAVRRRACTGSSSTSARSSHTPD